MPKLSPIGGRHLVTILEKSGFKKVHQKGSHARLVNPDGRRTTVPIHSGEKVGVGIILGGFFFFRTALSCGSVRSCNTAKRLLVDTLKVIVPFFTK